MSTRFFCGNHDDATLQSRGTWRRRASSALVPVVVVVITVAGMSALFFQLVARGDPEVKDARSRGTGTPHGARAGRLKVERPAVEGQRRSCIGQRSVDCRTEIRGGRPGIGSARARCNPQVERAERPGPIGGEEYFQAVTSDSGLPVDGRRIELDDWYARSVRSVWKQRARVDVGGARADRPRPEEQDTRMGRVVLKGVRGLVILGAVDATAEIHRSLPREVVSLVVASRDVDVVTPKPFRTITTEEQPTPAARQPRGLLVGGGVDPGTKVLRRPPGVAGVRSLRDVDVGPADTPRAVAAVEIETQSVFGEGRGLLDECCVDRGAEVHRGGPVRGLGRVPVRLLRGQQGGRDRLGRAGGIAATARGSDRDKDSKRAALRSHTTSRYARAGHGCSFPFTVRVDIQMSRLGRPFGADTLPGRLDVKTNIRPSKDRLGCCSKPAELSGAPGFSGVGHGSFALRRVDTQRSARPSPPAGAPRWNQISFPSVRTVGAASLAVGWLSSERNAAGPAVSPFRVTGAAYRSCPCVPAGPRVKYSSAPPCSALRW